MNARRLRTNAVLALRQALQAAWNPGLSSYLGMSVPRRSWRDGWHAQDGAIDAYILKRMNAYPDGVHDSINRRGMLLAHLQACAEGGQVAVVESGRDCDGVEYSGRVHLIPAKLLAYNKLESETSERADGPFSFSIMRPSDAAKLRYESRDLVMEAHENGHPHVIYSKFA